VTQQSRGERHPPVVLEVAEDSLGSPFVDEERDRLTVVADDDP
jgi:hypothetical protein